MSEEPRTQPWQPVCVGGREVAPEEAQREAYQILMALLPSERSRVLCWFCWCGEYIPPGAGRCNAGHTK